MKRRRKEECEESVRREGDGERGRWEERGGKSVGRV